MKPIAPARRAISLVLLVLPMLVALACEPAAHPERGACTSLPRGAPGCLDGNTMRPLGCKLPGAPAGPDSPGSNCTCVERPVTGVIEWDCQHWLM